MERPTYEIVGVTSDLSEAEALQPDVDFIEFEMEKSENPLESLTTYTGSIPIIVSYENTWSESPKQEPNRLDELLQASQYEYVDKVDLELGLVQENEWVIDELRQNDVEIIVSYKNYEETPPESELQRIIEEISTVSDVAKISVFANNEQDTLALLNCLNSASESGLPVAGFAHGEIGKHTRVISVFYGSKYSYGRITAEERDTELSEIEVDQLTDLLDSTAHGGDHVELIDSLKGKFS